MDELAPEDLYAERGEVPWSYPIMQGDVFDNVVLPGFGDEPRPIQIVMHPCVMRSGPKLCERITVAPVVAADQRITSSTWTKHLRVMPLPSLRDGVDYMTEFVDTTAVPVGELRLAHRVAALSQRGLLELQRRLIVHSTRYVEVDMDALRKVSAPVLTEAELEGEWVEAAVEKDGQTMEVVNAASSAFQEWLGPPNGERRKMLKSEVDFSALRREARAEMTGRYG